MSDKAAVDLAVGSAAVTAPLWAVNLTVWLNLIIAVGGLILLGLRIYKAMKE